MKFKFKEQTKENILSLTCSGILLLCFYFLITNFPQLKLFLGNIIGILLPFILVSAGHGPGRKEVAGEVKNEAVSETQGGRSRGDCLPVRRFNQLYGDFNSAALGKRHDAVNAAQRLSGESQYVIK